MTAYAGSRYWLHRIPPLLCCHRRQHTSRQRYLLGIVNMACFAVTQIARIFDLSIVMNALVVTGDYVTILQRSTTVNLVDHVLEMD
jgi:hypothetical protein